MWYLNLEVLMIREPLTVSRRQVLHTLALAPLLTHTALAQTTTPAPAPVSGSSVEGIWNLLSEFRSKLEGAVSLEADATTRDLAQFSNPISKASGMFYAASGPQIARVVHTRLSAGPFATMRLTAWVGHSLEVPHLVMEFGFLPQPFLYLDYIPRRDLLTDMAALERIYNPLNPTVLRFAADKRFTPYVSPSVYVRQFQSPVALSYSATASDETLSVIQETAKAHFERWLGWLGSATPTPTLERGSLKKRDLILRQQSAERDPGNALAGRLFGPEMASRLVRALWTAG
jgi:hypothetical protein